MKENNVEQIIEPKDENDANESLLNCIQNFSALFNSFKAGQKVDESSSAEVNLSDSDNESVRFHMRK
jgi:hypothetical protein